MIHIFLDKIWKFLPKWSDEGHPYLIGCFYIQTRVNSHLLHDNTLIIQLKQHTYIGNFTQKYLTRKSILYSFLLVFTQNYSKLVFFGNLILDSLDTRFMKATRVRVSTSVKKEVLMIEYSSEWVLSDHTTSNLSQGCSSSFNLYYWLTEEASYCTSLKFCCIL